MIASRFRPVGWVAAVAIAALGCYLVSLRVATKRGEVASVEAQILSARRDMRQLETELGTRSRLVQLERWNSQVLALSAPRVGQYLTSPMQLASLGALPDTPGAPAGTPGDGVVRQAAYQAPASTAVAQTVAATPARPAPAVRTVAAVAPAHRAKAELASAAASTPHLIHAVVKATIKLAHRPRVELTSAADAKPHVVHAVARTAKPSHHPRVELTSASGDAKPHVVHAVAKVAKSAHRPRVELTSASTDAKPHVVHAVAKAAKPARRPHVELASAADDDDTPALLHRASYVKMGGHSSARQVALLDDTALGAIERAARQETGEGKKQRR